MLTRCGAAGLLCAPKGIGIIIRPLLLALIRVLQVLDLLLPLLLLKLGDGCRAIQSPHRSGCQADNAHYDHCLRSPSHGDAPV